MKNTFSIALAFLLAVAVLPVASAQPYKWKDEKGQTVIGDTPPPRSSKAKKLGGDSGAAGGPTTAEPAATAATTPQPAAPKSAAEKEMEFRKRQQESREKEEKEAKEQADAAKRKQNCAQAQQALRTLESNQRITTINEKGENQFLDEEKRQAETGRAREAVAEWCK